MENKREENPQRKKKAELIIRNHMIWSMGAGLIPVPVADFFAVGAIQLDMIRQMCKLYEIDFKEKDGKAVVSALTGAGLSRLGASAAVKFVPGMGSIVGGVTMSVLSGASTFAIGEAFKKHFETGGTFLDLDTERIKKMYDDLFEKGKKMASDIQEEKKTTGKSYSDIIAEKADEAFSEEVGEDTDTQDHDQVIKKLKELAELKEKGVITEQEFEELKKGILKGK